MSVTKVVTLDVKRHGGVLYAKCAEVPGLYVKGADPEALRTVAMRAVKDLYQRNKHMVVEVDPMDDLSQLRIRTA